MKIDNPTSQSLLLSKSNFKVAQTCPTKLFYLKNCYPSTKSDNPYLEFLADGGFMIGKMAKIIHPGGIDLEDLSGTSEELNALTEAHLKQKNVTLFEAAVLYEGLIARIDILRKEGDCVELIEVKSKSFDSEKNEARLAKNGVNVFRSTRGGMDSGWKEYVEDIAFQVITFQRAYPDLKVKPYLLLPDKSRSTSLDNLHGCFKLVPENSKDSKFRKISVEFTGDEQSLREDHFLTRVDVSEEVEVIRQDVERSIEIFLSSLSDGVSKISVPIGKQCKECEFRSDIEKSGYKECWGELAEVTPHIFDLYQGTRLAQGGENLYGALLRSKKASLFDIPVELFDGQYGKRQQIQFSCTKDKKEWLSDTLKGIIESVKYPLHFLDFETSRTAVPYHAGMRPYEQIAFQFSCHTFESPDSLPIHSDWINNVETFPNFEFARELRRSIGENGTVLVWAHHESSVLKDIIAQMDKYHEHDAELELWLRSLVYPDEGEQRLLDLNKVTLNNYFHPEMKGSTSLKYVLPAVWKANTELHKINYFQKYVKLRDGVAVNPYETLPPIEIDGESRVVDEGTAAMRAYQEMMFGLASQDPARREALKTLLLQYCELDTLAMVAVWTHWRRHADSN